MYFYILPQMQETQAVMLGSILEVSHFQINHKQNINALQD